jgi:uncharacterized protein (TIGR00255 family)
MTAFASNEIKISNLTIICELRSVNHRYCDMYFKLPEQFRFIETELRRSISEKIKRGKIECSLNYKKATGNTDPDICINTSALKTLLHLTAEIEQQMHSSRSFSALEVLAFPGIQQTQEIDKELLQQGVIQLLNNTLASLVDVRTREGTQTGVLIQEKCLKMHELVAAATLRMPEVLTIMRARLTDRITEMVAAPDFDRLEQELVLLAQKMDVNEELERLDTHINEVQRTLQQSEPVGRRLDFLMQELNREANTLGSKSSDKEITQIAIELKVLIEQMREQIQNIE